MVPRVCIVAFGYESEPFWNIVATLQQRSVYLLKLLQRIVESGNCHLTARIIIYHVFYDYTWVYNWVYGIMNICMEKHLKRNIDLKNIPEMEVRNTTVYIT